MRPGTRQLLILLIVACAMFMQNMDSTVIATALPVIARSLNESPLQLNVAITCYLLSLAVFIPISGWTADRFGARLVFSSAIVVFTLGSIACGLSQSLWMLVIARYSQIAVTDFIFGGMENTSATTQTDRTLHDET
ncbi:MAG: MFS transporter, partial [Stellaceae bacterium]